MLDKITAATVDSGTVTVTVRTTDGTNITTPYTFDVNLPKADETDETDMAWGVIPDQVVTVNARNPGLNFAQYLTPATSDDPGVFAASTEIDVDVSDPSALRITRTGFTLTPQPVAASDLIDGVLDRQVTVTLTARRATGTKRGAVTTTINYTVRQNNRLPGWTGPAPSDVRVKVGGIARTINLDDHSVDIDNPVSRRRYIATLGSSATATLTEAADTDATRKNKWVITPVAAGNTRLHLSMVPLVGTNRDRNTLIYKSVTLYTDAADAVAPAPDPISHTPIPDFPTFGQLFPGGQLRIRMSRYFSASGNSGPPDFANMEFQIRSGSRFVSSQSVGEDTVLNFADSPDVAGGGIVRCRARARGVGATDWVPAAWDNFNIVISRKVAVERPRFSPIPVQRATSGSSTPFTLDATDYEIIPAGFGAKRYGISVAAGSPGLLIPGISAAGVVTIGLPGVTPGRYTITVSVASATDARNRGSGSFQLIVDNPSA